MSWDGNVITYNEHVWHIWELLVNYQDFEDNLHRRQNKAGDTHENHEEATTEIRNTSTDERDEAWYLRKEK